MATMNQTISVSTGRKFSSMFNMAISMCDGKITDELWQSVYERLYAVSELLFIDESDAYVRAATTGVISHIRRHGKQTEAFYSVMMYVDASVCKCLYVYNPILRLYSIVVEADLDLDLAYYNGWITKTCYRFLQKIDSYPTDLTTGVHAHKTLNVRVSDLVDYAHRPLLALVN
jgi:hypothetical protein